MPYEIEIEIPRESYLLEVDEVEFTDEGTMMFRGFDPSDCPENLTPLFTFHSKRLTAIITDQSQIEHMSISTHIEQDL